MKRALFAVLATLGLSAARAEEPKIEPTPEAPQTDGFKLWGKSLLNQKAPALVVEKWLTAEPDTKGKFVLLDFWATWCEHCQHLIPELNAFQKKYAAQLVVIGLTEEKEADVKKMIDPKIEYSSAIDTKGRLVKEIEINAIPHVILIDPEGIVRWQGVPVAKGQELTAAVLEALFEKYTPKPANR